EKPVVDAVVQVRPERVEKFALTMKAPGNDLRVTGSVQSFKAPKVNFEIASKGMDLDRLMKFETKAEAAGKAGGTKNGPSSESVDFDAMLEPVRKNGILKKATGVLTVNMAAVRLMNVAISSIQSRMSMRQLVFKLEKFGLGVFGGKVGASGTVNVQGKAPTYSLNVDVSGADLRQAVESQFAPFKNTLVGKGFFKMGVSGKSFNPPAAKANLSGQGNMRVEGARFNTIDIGRVAAEAVNKAMSDVAAKVPELRGKQLAAPKAVESEYESVTGNFTIQQSVFSAPDFFAKALPNRGLDIRGRTSVNLVTDALEADWELRDTYNALNARDMSIKIADQVVPQILAKDGVVVLPVQVRGSVFDPKVTYTSVPEALIRVALDNIKRSAENRAKAEVQKAVQNEAKKLFKGLFK
ncbi:MAG: AsmA family protein, partial [Bdellovibrionales bacterium]|nr:AsmA family protein [Bdellovibrionales bacterium]